MKILHYTVAPIIICCILYLLFVMLRDGVVFLLGTCWYDLTWRWQYIIDIGKLLVLLLAPACAWYIKYHIQIWFLRRKVIVNDDSIADYSPRRARPREEFTKATKEIILRRTLRDCGNKLLCFYTGRPVCFENQINLNGFKPGDLIHFDHVIPPKNGGDNKPENGVITSRDINLRKGDDIKGEFVEPVVKWVGRHGKTIHEDCLQ